MIRDRQLFNRINEGREVKSFSLWIVEPDPVDRFEGVAATYTKQNDSVWRIDVLFRHSQVPQVYSIEYTIPKRRAPLTLVAATGLANLLKAMDPELNVKGEMMFAIGDLIDGTTG